MPEVIVVGDVDADQFYIVPHLPVWDEGVLVDEWYEYPGGKGGNTAAALSKLGIQTGIITSAGDDHYGEVALEGLRNNGVDLNGVIVVPGGKTYYCIIMLDSTGEKSLLVVLTSLIYPTPQMVLGKQDILKSARHAHFIGINPVLMRDSIELAKKLGLSISVDLDAAYQGLEASQPLLTQADIVFMNQQGAARLYPGINLHDAVRAIRYLGPSIVVITMGRQGVIGYDGTNIIEQPAFNLRVQDTTGAGDVFSAGFVYGHLQGWNLETCLKFSSAAAALSTVAIGGQSALPTQSDVWKFINENSSVGL